MHKDFRIDIPDGSAKVPGTNKHIWEIRQEQGEDWEPGPDHPRIQAEPLPTRRTPMEARIHAVFKDAPKKGKPGDFESVPGSYVVQHAARRDFLDMRHWGPGEPWDNKLRRYSGPERPYGGLEGSLLFNTIHQCFSRHHPLGLRPDALLYAVLHEVGIAVRQNPDEYKDLFTASKEKELIRVQVNELNIEIPDGPWNLLVEHLYAGLSEKVPPGILEWMNPELSTHDLESRVTVMAVHPPPSSAIWLPFVIGFVHSKSSPYATFNPLPTCSL
jgi:hypothetical protein